MALQDGLIDVKAAEKPDIVFGKSGGDQGFMPGTPPDSK